MNISFGFLNEIFRISTDHREVKDMVVRNKFSKRIPVLLVCKEIGRVKPEFKKSCDVNEILKRYSQTGRINAMVKQPAFIDVSDVTEYQESLNIVIKAQQTFAELPAKVRDRFGNNPENFMEFVHEEGNEDEMIRLGLVKAIEEKKADNFEEKSRPKEEEFKRDRKQIASDQGEEV